MKESNGEVDNLYFLLSDHLAPCAALQGCCASGASKTVDANGQVVAELRYMAFGETWYENGNTPTELRYTGQRSFEELGLYFYQSRFYDAMAGRFVQADSIVPEPGSPMSWDRFSYVQNNPVRYSDPTGHRVDDGCQTEGCNLENQQQSFLVVVTTLIDKPRSWNELPEGYKKVLSKGGVDEKKYARSKMAGTLTSRALKGDLDAITQLLIPSHIGLRAQVEVSGDLGIGISGTGGVNLVYNRNSDELSRNVDWSAEPGGGFGAGVSATGGLLIGWGSGDVDDVVQGYSAVVSGTAAGGGAISAAVSVPLDSGTLVHVDSYTGQVPATLYIGGGGGAAYAGVGAGVSGPTGIVVDFTQLLPWH